MEWRVVACAPCRDDLFHAVVAGNNLWISPCHDRLRIIGFAQMPACGPCIERITVDELVTGLGTAKIGECVCECVSVCKFVRACVSESGSLCVYAIPCVCVCACVKFVRVQVCVCVAQRVGVCEYVCLMLRVECACV